MTPTLSPQQREEVLELLAHAYDKEDAAQRGEEDPWIVEDIEGDTEAERAWQADRKACAAQALDAALPAIIGACLSDPSFIARLAERCLDAPVVGEGVTISDFLSYTAADAIDLGITITGRTKDGKPRFDGYSDIRQMEFDETEAELMRRMLSGAIRALAEEARS